MDELVFGGTLFIIFIAVVFLIIIASFVPIRLWIEAMAAGVRIGLGTLIGMRLRKVNPAGVVRPLINATKAGLALRVDDLEAHYLAGGNVNRVVTALISADKAGIELPFQRAAAIDLAG
ncbi:MAG: flotillin-like FloA family protein, partial [Gemmatimonadetes bacterium]|nr:flotillin-like FloA family protein [Gemmatimonadota bacterium]